MDNNEDERQGAFLDATRHTTSEQSAQGNVYLLEPWSRLASRLRPLIGESGFCALYGRAVRVTAPQFHWLSINQSGNSIDALITALQRNLSTVQPGVAASANAALLNTFTKLLSSLIGEALTTRLLDSTAKEEDEQKNVQE